MTAGDPPAADIAGPAERYEQLRARALAGQPDGFRLGLAVLLRNGVAAWMHACAATRGDNVHPTAAKATSPNGGQLDEVVAVLSAMAMACGGG